MTAPFGPGIYDLTEAEYFAATEALSCSGAKLLLPPFCPALFRYRQDHPERKDTFDFGSAAHKLVLGTGPEIALVDAKDWRTKAAQEAKEAAYEQGAVPLLLPDLDKVVAMAAAIRSHPLAGVLLDPDRGGKPERSLFWADEETGVPRRCRLDWLPEAGHGRFIVTDYKTCESASPAAIRKAVANYGYYQQDPYYLDGVRALGIDDDPAFLFILQEKSPPYLVNVVQLDDEARVAGGARNRQAIERFRDCSEAGVWPGYEGDVEPGEIQQISLPPWAARALEVAR